MKTLEQCDPTFDSYFEFEDAQVLIIDDSAALREQIRLILSGLDISLHFATDGLDALVKIQQLDIDLVLCDLVMPNMDGFGFIKRVREQYPNHLFPIILMTTESRPENLAQAFTLGANDFIAKPFNKTEVQSRVLNQFCQLKKFRSHQVNEINLRQSVVDKNNELTELISELQAEMAYRLTTESRLAQYKHALDHSPASIVITDDKGLMVYANIASFSYLSLDTDYTKTFDPIFDPSQRTKSQLDITFKALETNGYWHFEQKIPVDCNEVQWEQVEVTAMRFSNKKLYFIVRQDITDQKESNIKLERLASVDNLTGLPNKNGLHNYLDRIPGSLPRSEWPQHTVSAYTIEVDNYASLKEVHGHQFAQKLIEKVSQLLLQQFDKQIFLSCIGEYQFVAVHHTGTALSPVEKKVGLLVQASLHEPMHIDGKRLWITASVGHATVALSEHFRDNLLLSAETALNKAKLKGHANIVRFDASIKQASQRVTEIEQELHGAIEGNEFFLHYQPIISADSRNVRSAEALLRWRSPTKGLISPAEFIPIAEKSSVIIEIGEWLIESIAKQLQVWLKYDKDFKVAMNLSASQLKKNYNLIDMLVQTLKKYKVPHSALEIEVTEHIFLDEASFNLSMLDDLRKEGFSLAIDDFGTGYSSLSYLSRFDFDKLKIDQHFVKDLLVSKKSHSIIHGIIEVATALDMKVTVEGIENQDILAIMKEYNVDFLQGYYFSKPVDHNKFTQGFLNRDAPCA